MIKTNFQFDLLMKKIFTLCCSLLSMISIAQVGIGTTDPKATLDIQGSPAQNNITDGIIAPRITGNQLQAKTYTAQHVGALLYVTAIPTAASGQVAEINTPGYYYFDGSTWKQFGILYSESFNHRVAATNDVIMTQTHQSVLTYTIPTSGQYEIDAFLDYTLDTNQPIRYYLARNGTAISQEKQGYQINNGVIIFTPAQSKIIATLSAGDVITLRAYANFGTSTLSDREMFIKKIAGLVPAVAPSINTGNNIFGDVKSGFQTTDHDGWILLNGRNINLLTPSQQLRASQLGFSTTIPNANSAYLVQNGTGLGTLSNNNSKTIVRANLPNVDISTSSNGAHNHTFATRSGGVGNQAIVSNQNSENATTSSTNSVGDHSHTFNLNGNVTQAALDVRPLSLSVNMFVFLGL